LILRVEENVLTTLVRGVVELEGQSTGRHDRDIREVPEPVLVRDEVVLVDARTGVVSPQTRTGRNRSGAADQQECGKSAELETVHFC